MKEKHLGEKYFSSLTLTDPLIFPFFLSQEDFVKWKGALFYRFVTTLVDDDPEIRKFGLLLNVFLQCLRISSWN